ncbi:hypothetical protein ACFL3S_11645 [Gemmatimonadota bacterium]
MRARRGGAGPVTRLMGMAAQASIVSLLVGSVCGELEGQVTWEDLVLTWGVSGEGYRGNLAAVTAPAVDSSNRVSAAVGELGIRGGLLFANNQRRTVGLRWDAGLRQFVTGGFREWDYAPREWVGRADFSFRQAIGSASDLRIQLGATGRQVDDRPPMPLFIQPGYGSLDGALGLQFRPVFGVRTDARILGEFSRYQTGQLTPQLGLLDRDVLGAEVGAALARWLAIRFHAGFRIIDYPNQGTFDPGDPVRRDRMLSFGATWALQYPLVAQVGVEGIRNRSNSRRPEYNAVRLRSVVSAPLPLDLSMNLFAVLTTKSYLEELEVARLVPGEEADNASVVYLELARPVQVNLDGAIRFGWTRAESDFGDDYFERLGVTVLFHYRPWER